jgi:putative ubiquitin-RnfH superfamily antitoxin RatB of RatAB toxin-antitoxin module
MASITVEVAYALPEQQKIIAFEVEEGTLAIDAARQSGIEKTFPEVDVESAKMGVFGKAIKPASYVMQAGDRIEIYRPLKSDPKASRKARAEKAKAAK